MENILEQKTTRAIKKLEEQFKSTFMAYTSAKNRDKRQEAHEKLERKSHTNCEQIQFDKANFRSLINSYNYSFFARKE